ncbi:MAG: CPBP family intramembrane metalloprotease [Ruminococcus sp.]|nr:CPBP family intramembrane metalloprotease [Ruminococcus sp.]MBQ8904830.1 CPBP family intramembrane metalloprotease [Ruminococcus sp.]
MQWLKERPSVLREGCKNAYIPQSVILIILIFLAVFGISQLAVSIIPTIIVLPETVFYLLGADIDLTDSQAVSDYVMGYHMSDAALIAQLYATTIGTMLAIVFCLDIEKRSFSSMGFVKKRACTDYLLGAVIGVAMLGGAVGFGVLTGSMSYESMGLNGKTGLLLVLLGGWLLQGMSEEVIFRGYFCNTLAARTNRHVAAVISSVGFMLAHFGNPGITPLACLNLFLFGMFAAYFMFRFDSLWGIGALHSLWNFSQGNLFGVQVSGLDTSVSVFRFSVDADKALLNGGSFGLEGGLGVTIVFLIGIALLLFVPVRKTAESEITA